MPMGSTTSSPTYLLADSVRSPLFGLWKVTVRAAFTALSLTSPVSGSRPLGTSTATLGAGAMFMSSTAVAWGSLRAPRMPVPNTASTITWAHINQS